MASSWLFALEHPTSRAAAAPTSGRAAGAPTETSRSVTYDQQLLATAPVIAGRALHEQRSARSATFRRGWSTMHRDNLQLPRGNPRTIAFARDLRSARASGSRLHRRGARTGSATNRSSTRWRRTFSTAIRSTVSCSTRGAASASTTPAPSSLLMRAAGIPARVVTGLPGRRNESDRRVHDRAPVRCARVGRGADRRRSGSASIRPPRSRRRASSAASAPRCPRASCVPYLARLDMTWLKSLSLHWDAINYHWQRGVVGFNLERQRDLLRDFGLDGARAVAAHRGARWRRVRLGNRGARFLAPACRARIDAEVALWTRACRRLCARRAARAGRTRGRWRTRERAARAGRQSPR